ncbi:MAG: glutamate-ammonia-ligase adenylyltransferase [Gammaproteobacteria bacterium]|nr:MAG: glutamate-ammonia-ligase adenylyltransferase [Gammaproteobacteria bacterium]
MDRGTKIYAVILGIFTLSLAITFLYESPKVAELNKQLASIEDINKFPYHFKVLRIENGIAIMSTPRSTEIPVTQILGIIFPEVKGKASQSPEFQIAQKSLAEVQTLARDTIMSDKEIKQIRWELDRGWLIQHGISVNTIIR